uniref:Lipoprotein n=1 Tax=viral metagenome TaxID=1070528 RepID=A0A6H1ZAF8_9ZZZZ
MGKIITIIAILILIVSCIKCNVYIESKDILIEKQKKEFMIFGREDCLLQLADESPLPLKIILDF